MELLDPFPTLRRFGPEAEGALLQHRRPSLGEYLSASIAEGWWNTTLGAGKAVVDAARGEIEDPTPLSEQEWRASPFYREGVPYDPRMTRGRAEAIARVFDENAYRRRLLDARDPGALDTVLGFGAQIVGSVPDPANFLPIAGPGARALRAFGSAATPIAPRAADAAASLGTLLQAPTIGAGVRRGVIDAVGGTAVSLPFVYSAQEQFGEEITWARAVADLSIAAVIGAAFGGVFGALAARAARAVDPVAAHAVVRSMAGDVAAGRPVEMPSAVMRSAIDETIVRTAPDAAAPFIRERNEGGRIVREADLPRRSDGTPLTREEFEAELQSREMAMRAERGETVTQAVDDPAPGMVRMYHGGDPEGDSPLWFSTSRKYAEGYATKQGRNAGLWFVDVPRDNPIFRSDWPNQTVDQGFTVNAELPADIARTRRRLGGGNDAAYGWYRSSLEAQDRARALQDTVDARAGADAPEARKADPEMEAIAKEIEEARRAGRITAADDAALRAGNDAAAEIEAQANGLEQAAVCMLARAV